MFIAHDGRHMYPPTFNVTAGLEKRNLLRVGLGFLRLALFRF